MKCGEDINSTANAKIVGELAAFLQELAIPWLVVGGFQVRPEQWDGHRLLNVLKAELVCSGQPTMVHGAELDYLLACRTIAPFIHIKVNGDVCWRPHNGLVMSQGWHWPK